MPVANCEIIVELLIHCLYLIVFRDDEVDLRAGVSNEGVKSRYFCLGLLQLSAKSPPTFFFSR
jgi:hypothetical protein